MLFGLHDNQTDSYTHRKHTNIGVSLLFVNTNPFHCTWENKYKKEIFIYIFIYIYDIKKPIHAFHTFTLTQSQCFISSSILREQGYMCAKKKMQTRFKVFIFKNMTRHSMNWTSSITPTHFLKFQILILGNSANKTLLKINEASAWTH